MRQQGGDLDRAERARLPEVGVRQLRSERVAGVHRRHLRRFRLHGHGLLLLGRRGQRHAKDEDRSLVDQFAGQRRRDVRARLVVLDEQLDLAAEHPAPAVDLGGAEQGSLRARLRVRLGDPDAVGDHADLDGLLRKATCGEQRRRDGQQLPHASLLLNRADSSSASILHKDRPPA